MSNNNKKAVVGIIGGSGIYNLDGLSRVKWVKVDSSFGSPSDELLFGELNGQQVIFLPRHGRGHRIPPSEINYRANIDALKRVGVTDIISMSAVGSLREDLKPGMFVIIDQFIDRTFARNKSFFGTGCVAHVSMAHPVCARLGDHIELAAKSNGIEIVRGGTYLVMEGPQFSSFAESQLYRSWNCDVIGMTNMPEAKLAREAEICYATVAMITDYDCWHPEHDAVAADQVLQVFLNNADKARNLVKAIIPKLLSDQEASSCSCRKVLDSSLVTAKEAQDPVLLKQLEAIIGRVHKPKSIINIASESSMLKQQLVMCVKRLVEFGLNRGTCGNCSVRFGGGFLITPSGISVDELDASKIIEMDFEGNIIKNHTDLKPSTEWRFHRDILKQRSDINAVVHTHSNFATACSCLRQDIPPFHYMIALAGGDTIRCASYALFGSQKLSDCALKALEARKACLLANHGMIALGSTLREAEDIAFEVESLCRQYLLALQTGAPKLLSEHEMTEAIAKFEDYGNR